jgi:hypothetical protein
VHGKRNRFKEKRWKVEGKWEKGNEKRKLRKGNIRRQIADAHRWERLSSTDH